MDCRSFAANQAAPTKSEGEQPGHCAVMAADPARRHPPPTCMPAAAMAAPHAPAPHAIVPLKAAPPLLASPSYDKG